MKLTISAFPLSEFQLFPRLWRRGRAMLALFRPAIPLPPPQQLDLGLDRITEGGLPLRDAMTVRCAEFWLALGEPRLALRELDSLTDLTRQNAWTARVHLRASHSAGTSIPCT